MKTKFLFPNKFKALGWLLFIPSVIITVIISLFNINTDEYLNVTVFAILNDFPLSKPEHFTFIKNSIVDELLLIGLVCGGILVGFSKLKIEDEFTTKIRYESLVWAIYLNYGLILLFTIFVYGMGYMQVLIHNVFTVLLFFILRFHYMIYKQNKSLQDD
ncbi:MAG: hypothetical protein U0T80_07395 [Flavobacteriaceae bacterium]